MTLAAEKLMTMVQEMPIMIPKLSEDKVQQVLNIFAEVEESAKSEDEERKALAQHRRNLLKMRKYVRPSGRTYEEIDSEIREMRSDRL